MCSIKFVTYVLAPHACPFLLSHLWPLSLWKFEKWNQPPMLGLSCFKLLPTYTLHCTMQLSIERTTGVVNTVWGYHATSCSLGWLAVNFFLSGMGRQTQFWSGPIREHVTWAPIANLKLHVLPLVKIRTKFQSERLGDRLLFSWNLVDNPWCP